MALTETRVEDERYTEARWRCDVRDGDTLLGYWQWVEQQREGDPSVKRLLSDAVEAEARGYERRAVSFDVLPETTTAATVAPMTVADAIRNLRWDVERYADARAELHAQIERLAQRTEQ